MDAGFMEHVNAKLNESLLRTEELFVENINSWVSGFADHFQNICQKVRKWRDEPDETADVLYLECLMLYTNYIKRQYVADIFVFSDKSYLDKNQQCIGCFDVSFLFVYFDKLWDELILSRKRYQSQVSAQDVTSFMLNALPDFYSYLTCIARVAIRGCTDKKRLCYGIKNPIADIAKNGRFMVNVGDFMAKTETVYEERKNKDAKKLADWFGKKLRGDYVFGDYSNLDFTGGVFEYIDFRYAWFQDSVLVGANLDGSSLIGTNFRNAKMERCRMDNCSIHEADFSNASLNYASFVNARAKAGLAGEKKWKGPGFLPVSFYCADLMKADFRRAALERADFRKASLKGADFTDAVLAGADFTDAVLTGADFAGAMLLSANFENAILDDVNFTGAIIDDAF